MIQTTALEMYHHFVDIIDQAPKAENVYAAPEAAEAAGMVGGEEPQGMGQRWNYACTDGSGAELLVHARCDQTKMLVRPRRRSRECSV